MNHGVNRRVVNKVSLRISQLLLVVVIWAMSYSIVKAFEPDQRAISVLQYHHVSEDTPFLTSIKPQDFEAHLDYLVENDFDVISLSEFQTRLKTKKLESKKTALITFDDAYASIYEVAWPLLKARNFPFAVFVNTKAVDQGFRHSMTWDQMQEMSESGVQFANHTDSHLHLIRKEKGETDQEWLLRIRSEIELAESKIQTKLGQSHKALAYPFGEYNPDVKTLLKVMGYVGFAQHSGAVGVVTDPQAIPRFPFGGFYSSLDGFITKVNALAMPVIDVRLGYSISPQKEVTSDEENKVAADVLVSMSMDKLDWVYAHDNAQPSAFFELDLTDKQGRRLTCYASGQGQVPLVLVGTAPSFQGFLVEMKKTAPVGRSRFNCTLPSQWAGRYYWFSQPIIRLAENNQWYPE